MKMLYFPGLISLIEKNSSVQSSKLVHLAQLYECSVFDYHTFHLPETLKFIRKFDILTGSSFGGFFAFFLALRTGQKCININPSLYLDKRFAGLIESYPSELGFLKQAHLNELVSVQELKNCKNIHVLMNLDDEVLDAAKILGIAEKYGCSTYTFEKGGHESSNFIGEMLPLIKQISCCS